MVQHWVLMRSKGERGGLTKPDYFRMDTEQLNAAMRTTVDALRSQVNENPLATDRQRAAGEALNEAAGEFTNALYEPETPRATDDD